MADCLCDYDPPSVWRKSMPVARKPHRCEECGQAIPAGERYERVFGVWEGHADTFKTCVRCLAVRAFVRSLVPCFCWAHGNLHEDARCTAEEYAHEADGLLFGTLRRIVIARRGAHG